MIWLLVLVSAYLLGAIPFGYLLVRWKTGGDVRASGSGNIGATNVLRTTGKAAGIATLLLDIGKGYLAVWLAGRLTDHDPLWMSVAALTVMAGHAYPVFLKFKGGKAVASFVGAFLCLTPGALAVEVIVFVAVVAWTRHISMGSIVGAATFPLAVWLILKSPEPVVAAAIVGGAFIIYKHSANIARLRAGTESVFRLRSKKP
jgi:acyl phosphate:glycerol-3-phosphate acyltransferase